MPTLGDEFPQGIPSSRFGSIDARSLEASPRPEVLQEGLRGGEVGLGVGHVSPGKHLPSGHPEGPDVALAGTLLVTGLLKHLQGCPFDC